MDFISIAGLVVAIIAIFAGQLLEGGHMGSLMQLTASIIVLGGTLGAVMLQSSPRSFLEAMRLARWIIFPPRVEHGALIERIVSWSVIARKGGLLALEPMIRATDHNFEKKALQMLVDGAEPDVLRESLRLDVESYEEHHRQAANVWEAAGGYAPTIGILGAVMGLIHVMENLSEPAKLGGGIAVAFVATIYGVGLANLVFLPIAAKLKSIIAKEATQREMMIEGLVAIANGINPRLIETRLEGYVVI